MQVAHSVDLENVGEHGHHEHVADKAESVVLEVAQVVQWAHDARQQVDRQHDDTCKAEQTEVGLWVVCENTLVRARIRRVHNACSNMREEATLGQEVGNASDR